MWGYNPPPDDAVAEVQAGAPGEDAVKQEDYERAAAELRAMREHRMQQEMPMESPVPEPLRSLVLEKIKIQAQRKLSEAMLRDAQIADPVMDHQAGALVMALRTHVFGQRLTPRVERSTVTMYREIPDGWWETWKAEHAGRWYARWMTPVRTRKIGFTMEAAISVERVRAFPYLPLEMERLLGRESHIVEPGPMFWREKDGS